jgi:hypothetical protein
MFIAKKNMSGADVLVAKDIGKIVIGVVGGTNGNISPARISRPCYTNRFKALCFYNENHRRCNKGE